VYAVMCGGCRFKALRARQGRGREENAQRPFARMHLHFVLARGEKVRKMCLIMVIFR
jgi:hypothetical protein